MSNSIIPVVAILAVLVIAAGGYFVYTTLPLVEPLSPREEFEQFALKAQDAPNHKSNYDFSMKSLARGMQYEINADIIYEFFSKDKGKISLSMSVLGMDVSAESFLVKGNQITCSSATGGLQSTQSKCSLGKSTYSGFTSRINQSSEELMKFAEDVNIEKRSDKKIAERNSSCFFIRHTGTDLNILQSSGLGLAGENTLPAPAETSAEFSDADSTEEIGMPVGFSTLLSGVSTQTNSQQEVTMSMEICFDKETAITTLLDINMAIKYNYSPTETWAGLNIEMTNIEFGVVKEESVTAPMALVLQEPKCEKKNVEFAAMALKNLEGEGKLTIADSYSIPGNEKVISKELGPVSLTEAEFKEYTIDVNGISSGSKIVTFCVGEECAESTCYLFSSLFSNKFYLSLTRCGTSSAELSITPYELEDLGSELKAEIYKKTYDANSYQYKEILLKEKTWAGITWDSKDKKVFMWDYNSLNTAEGDSIVVKACIGDDCDERSCFLPISIPVTTPTPVKIDTEGKIKDCTEKLSDKVLQANCLAAYYSKHYKNKESMLQLEPICDKLKELAWAARDKLWGSDDFGTLYDASECYARYFYYSGGSATDCEKEFEGMVVSAEGYGELDLESECKRYYVNAVASS